MAISSDALGTRGRGALRWRLCRALAKACLVMNTSRPRLVCAALWLSYLCPPNLWHELLQWLGLGLAGAGLAACNFLSLLVVIAPALQGRCGVPRGQRPWFMQPQLTSGFWCPLARNNLRPRFHLDLVHGECV